jgi:hypothetical protein
MGLLVNRRQDVLHPIGGGLFKLCLSTPDCVLMAVFSSSLVFVEVLFSSWSAYIFFLFGTHDGLELFWIDTWRPSNLLGRPPSLLG